MAQGKFAKAGNQPQKTPPVCKKQPPDPNVVASTITLLTFTVGYECRCDPSQPIITKNTVTQLTYNAYMDQWIGEIADPTTGVMGNVIVDGAPPPYCGQLSLKILLPCGDEIIKSYSVCPGKAKSFKFGLQTDTKHCAVGIFLVGS